MLFITLLGTRVFVPAGFCIAHLLQTDESDFLRSLGNFLKWGYGGEGKDRRGRACAGGERQEEQTLVSRGVSGLKAEGPPGNRTSSKWAAGVCAPRLGHVKRGRGGLAGPWEGAKCGIPMGSG